MEVSETVKFFDPARGSGFVVPDSGGREVYVHSDAAARRGCRGRRALPTARLPTPRPIFVTALSGDRISRFDFVSSIRIRNDR